MLVVVDASPIQGQVPLARALVSAASEGSCARIARSSSTRPDPGRARAGPPGRVARYGSSPGRRAAVRSGTARASSSQRRSRQGSSPTRTVPSTATPAWSGPHPGGPGAGRPGQPSRSSFSRAASSRPGIHSSSSANVPPRQSSSAPSRKAFAARSGAPSWGWRTRPAGPGAPRTRPGRAGPGPTRAGSRPSVVSIASRPSSRRSRLMHPCTTLDQETGGRGCGLRASAMTSELRGSHPGAPRGRPGRPCPAARAPRSPGRPRWVPAREGASFECGRADRGVVNRVDTGLIPAEDRFGTPSADGGSRGPDPPAPVTRRTP